MSARRKKEKFLTIENRPELFPLNDSQKQYMRAIIENDMVCVYGPSRYWKNIYRR